MKSVSLTDDLIEEIEKRADKLGIKFSDMIRRMLHQFLELEQRQKDKE